MMEIITEREEDEARMGRQSQRKTKEMGGQPGMADLEPWSSPPITPTRQLLNTSAPMLTSGFYCKSSHRPLLASPKDG